MTSLPDLQRMESSSDDVRVDPLNFNSQSISHDSPETCLLFFAGAVWIFSKIKKTVSCCAHWINHVENVDEHRIILTKNMSLYIVSERRESLKSRGDIYNFTNFTRWSGWKEQSEWWASLLCSSNEKLAYSRLSIKSAEE